MLIYQDSHSNIFYPLPLPAANDDPPLQQQFTNKSLFVKGVEKISKAEMAHMVPMDLAVLTRRCSVLKMKYKYYRLLYNGI